ncbi:PepSY-associated TM helix domain-containing protein [Propionivibrio dicarboxylicus]|uniref:Uncharacterized iron-regulated membrane protein n=1 Tax=Propionivibrio dicarboxylicus TaxID=83767 RepID=A0A1G7VPN1_9RHOO|nr:PepSY-associated TM helix domain-containing protein [Propionivibrio dicarboxylicus]SDG61379.1 Uncharacterized iron-regulated membrane protein [Propionivibrio dicarboxylicus]
MLIRPWLVRLHRYVGLAIAPFLVVTGLTGALISWDHELDAWLNPRLLSAVTRGPEIPSLALAAAIEARDPRVRVTYVPLSREPGAALAFGVEPRIDRATGTAFAVNYNQVFVDPVSGAELGRREWGAVWPITRETAVSFLYKLHFSLHVPEIAGNDRWGIWLLGGVALLWLFDCLTALLLTFPAPLAKKATQPVRAWWRRWSVAWQIRRGSAPYRFNYDIHRAFGLWTWGVLLVLAFTAFSLNLYREVFYPLMSTVSEVTPTPYETRAEASPGSPFEPRIGFAEAIAAAQADARRRGWHEPPGGAFYSSRHDVFSVQFFHPGEGHGSAGVGPAQLFVDAGNGALIGERLPWHGTLADRFMQAQFPLHSGRILGLPGRIAVSMMGLVVAMLSLTGIYLWWKKRDGRRRSQGRRTA